MLKLDKAAATSFVNDLESFIILVIKSEDRASDLHEAISLDNGRRSFVTKLVEGYTE